ncbi:CRISPR-associated endonuclease Cas1 [Thauera sp.]|uniref:CRISPR-associated endonuclease Cas1 n=1 Tax=Thauera sp. TaxID=1905334 RepID=UPI001B6F7ADF|nr:CRISPR-associated endonuclease Cas1 [Thauera sp.]HMZ30484.1 CRISPR-associated endonuclease Cas1 [Thauera aminoaromatica]MBP6130146.1 CRISPR-associated endonuclease Cas1 [Thauera sp.]MBP7048034.1 CRISPR-associated endonuclease Cas1 [Thauera sp.]MBX3684249.1 CRISPR-associated endonuclease Cas1 [Thauera sp.]HNB06913.1 CRISPR-associated endonuclease Cas1 [Thauera aminoaromatica]
MVTPARRTHAAAALPPRKPLYLLASTPARMDAGPDHLVLRRDQGAPLRFPLARLCRIVCNRHVAWSGQALALCLEHGVPITWVDGRGHALGCTQGHQDEALPFATLLETYLELPDWPARFANWRARRRLETLTTTAQRAARAGREFDPIAFSELKRELVYNGTHPLVFPEQGQAWCEAIAIDRLQHQGLQACYWGFGASRLALGVELGALLWAELNLECGALPAGVAPGQSVARLFEAWAHEHEGRLLLHLGDLERHLAREVEAWQ